MRKRYRIKFIGGGRDGEVLSSQSDDENEKTLASFFYKATHHGEIGKRVQGASPRRLELMQEGVHPAEIDSPAEFYGVLGCIEEDGETIITMKHLRSKDDRIKTTDDSGDDK